MRRYVGAQELKPERFARVNDTSAVNGAMARAR
jgi:hypothetical protein